MKCDKCGKDANIEIFLKADGIEEKLNLCFNCYSNMLSENLSNTGGFNPNYMKDLAKSIFNAILDEEKNLQDKTCPNCGLTLKDFYKNKRLGCSYCYEAFREEILKYLSKDGKTLENKSYFNHNNNNLDKKMSLLDSENSNSSSINEKDLLIRQKKLELEAAIKDEYYEKAAYLRDEIKALKEEGENIDGKGD